MSPIVAINPVDRAFYADRLRDFLPERLIDIHAHIWLPEHIAPREPGQPVTWPERVADSCSVEELLEHYRLMLPGKHVTPLVFSNPLRIAGLDVANAYIRQAGARHHLPALLLTDPAWTAEAFESRLDAGGFLGAKVYHAFAPPRPAGQGIRIFDFAPPHLLDVLDRRRLILMLHLPRPDRLRDPANLADLLEIERRWPGARVVVAHVGRAYCPEDIGDAFETLAPARRLLFDISANTNAGVFRRLLAAVGPRRILFGTDMPIARMRMRRICENGTYINLVPRGLCGNVAADPHMREVDPPDADRLTLFLYEELDAFRRAAEAEGLSRAELQAVFHDNAAWLLDEAVGKTGKELPG